MHIPVTNEQRSLAVDTELLRGAVLAVMNEACRSDGEVSVAVVDDATIHRLNARFLRHDYATDVLSFVLEDDGRRLDGEIVVSADTAIRNAAEYGWAAQDELLLYAIHGALHLIGYRDKTDEDAAEMRRAESDHLLRWGVRPPADATEGANQT